MDNIIQELKKKMGLLGKPMYRKEDYDYSQIEPNKWYYVQGDGGMLGKDIISKRIAMIRVITWAEHKRQQQEFKKWKEEQERRCYLPDDF